MADISRCRRDGGGFRENRSTNGMSRPVAVRATAGQTGRRPGGSDWRDIKVERTHVAREIRLQRRVGCVYGGPSAARTWRDIEEIAYTSTISVGHLGCRYPAPLPQPRAGLGHSWPQSPFSVGLLALEWMESIRQASRRTSHLFLTRSPPPRHTHYPVTCRAVTYGISAVIAAHRRHTLYVTSSLSCSVEWANSRLVRLGRSTGRRVFCFTRKLFLEFRL